MLTNLPAVACRISFHRSGILPVLAPEWLGCGTRTLVGFLALESAKGPNYPCVIFAQKNLLRLITVQIFH